MNWKPQDNFYIGFSDETGLDRTEEELQEMVGKIRPTVNEYGFDIHHWGGETGMKIFFNFLNEKK